MLNFRIRYTFLGLILLSVFAFASCKSGTSNSKELELKEKELALKERELNLKEKGSEGDDSGISEDKKDEEADKSERSKNSEPIKKGVYTPKVNSPERKAIMNTLRGPVQRELKQEIKFKVGKRLKVSGEWAFLAGEPLNKVSGKRPDPTGTKYYEKDWQNYDNNVYALLKKKGGKWTVVEYEMMCADVCYSSWRAKHGAPKEIFN